jgi:transcriptional regulator with XRE-family HTH domain
MNTLGERLSAVRERRGLTQGEVARRIGLPQQAISRLERGERQHVRSDVLARLAIALDVSADVLLGLRDMTASEAALSAARPHADAQDTTSPPQRPRRRTAAPVA